MKGLEKITDRIRSDAMAEIESIRAEGNARAAEVTASYQKQADQIAVDEAQRSELAAQTLLERRQSGDDMDRSKKMLAAKQASIDEAFARAAETLRQLPREEYAEVLAKIAAASGQGGEEIVLSAADAAELGERVVRRANELKPGAAFTLSAETRELEGGLVLKQGAVELNCAFATQLRLLRQTMAADVAAILFS